MKVTIKQKSIFKFFIYIIIIATTFSAGFFFNQCVYNSSDSLLSPFVSSGNSFSYPLLKYSINNLQNYPYTTSEIVLEELIQAEDTFDSYLFSYTTMGKRMTGQINIPDSITASPTQNRPAVILVRGYVPEDIYTTGMGTKNAASALAKAGYITLAPDFFGYGDSDPEDSDTWKTRFEKPIVIIELMKSLEEFGITKELGDTERLSLDNLGIWAHSNGGQIALTTLEALGKPIPTTLWAPVTAPFPYSILYFGDELADEGKLQRKWLAQFEEQYDVFEFSLTQHLDRLTGPIQIHHGDSDDAALIYWSNEFVEKIDQENNRRAEIITLNQEATMEADITETPLPPIDVSYYKYPNTNHNMVPSWDKVMKRDISFFNEWLKK